MLLSFFHRRICIFFFPPSVFWTAGIIVGSFLAGGCVAAWAFYLKSDTPKNERTKTIADMLILSNILMILCNMAAIHLSPQAGLALAMLMLLGAFVLALKLPEEDNTVSATPSEKSENPVGIARLLVFCAYLLSLSPLTPDSCIRW